MSEVWLPADTVYAVVDREGWDAEAIRDACPSASYEMAFRRPPVIAMAREATLVASIVDDRRSYFRRSSSKPWLPFRRMLYHEALTWQRATIALERWVPALLACPRRTSLLSGAVQLAFSGYGGATPSRSKHWRAWLAE